MTDIPDGRWCALVRGSGSGRRRSGPEPSEPQRPRVVDRADFDPHHDPSAPIVCEICCGVMVYTAACKIQCRVCGYKRDCSDP